MSNKTMIEIQFHISSKNIPHAGVITNKLGIDPTEFHNKGDKKNCWYLMQSSPFSPIQIDTEWTLSTGDRETYLGDELINELLNRLKGKEDLINEIISEYNAITEIDIICYYRKNDKPVFSFTYENIAFISKLKARIDIDFYDFD